ncbi:omcB [Symbiodinium necroappetens]|uniref:OmcB protein n=1 Tax=Symbiodinium necroappetens TaxID=1628268 RepID=A0A812T8C4_9DINO|nr:omcB [Symbiodinium necroappetens]
MTRTRTRRNTRIKAPLAIATAAALGGGLAMTGCTSSRSTAMHNASYDSTPTYSNAASFSDLAISVEKKAPGKVRVGEAFTYEIRVRNNTDATLHNVVINEQIERAGYAVLSSAPDRDVPSRDYDTTKADYPQWKRDPPGNSYDDRDMTRDYLPDRRTTTASNATTGEEARRVRIADLGAQGENTWRIGTLAPGESEVITVKAVAAEAGTLASCMTVDYDPIICTTVEAVEPELKIERLLADGQSSVYACDDIKVTYRITNAGGIETRPLTLEEPLPRAIRTSNGSGQVAMNFDTIRPGKAVTKTVTLSAQDAYTFRNRAFIETADGEKIYSNFGEIDILDPEISLSVDGPSSDYMNRTITHTVTVRNTSEDPAKDVKVTADMPAGIKNLAFSSQRLERRGNTVTIGDLAPGEARSFNFTFEPNKVGDYSSSFTATGYCVDQQVKTVNTDVKGIPAIRIEVIDKNDPVRVGEEAHYEVRVKNQGSAKGLDINLVAMIPEQMEFVRAEGDRTAEYTRNMITFEPVPELAPGDIEVWNLFLKTTDEGRVKFEVRLKSDVNTTDVIEQEPTTIFK